MRTSTIISSLTVLAGLSLVKAADYGPCPYKENENCWEIMDNTGCFLNPTSTEQIFGCITAGKEGVCACYGCLGYTPVTELIRKEDACRGVNTDAPAPAPTSIERVRRVLRA